MKIQEGGTLVEDARSPFEEMDAINRTPAASLDPAPIVEKTKNWTRWVAPVLSVALIVAVISQIDGSTFGQVLDQLPSSPVFWMVFAVYYFIGPASEWIVYRHLWKIPVSGFAALTRKLVSNEVLLGYIGEVYFYAWAREKTGMPNAPFGAIKDVTILSALVGNIVTLVLLALLYPWLDALKLGDTAQTFYASVFIVLLTTSIFLVFRNRLFSLPRSTLFFVSGVHLARIFVWTVSSALLWHLVLPDVSFLWWMILAAARLFLSRLPFLPNKDILFAGLAVFFVGNDLRIGALMTLMATIILGFHLFLGITLSFPELLKKWRKT